MNIQILQKAREMLAGKLEAGQFLRVVVTQGGCAGLTYSAEISRDLQDGETVVLEQGDIRIVSNPESLPYLDGLTIDFSEALIGGGLQFTNARTERTCGCGASFSLTGFPVIDSGNCGKAR